MSKRRIYSDTFYPGDALEVARDSDGEAFISVTSTRQTTTPVREVQLTRAQVENLARYLRGEPDDSPTPPPPWRDE